MKFNTKMMKILFICLLFILSVVNLQAQNDTDFISKIKREALKLKADNAEYKKYLTREDSLFHLKKKDIELGMHIIYQPSLNVINAPLAYFYTRLKENPERFSYYLEAISISEDIENRQKFISHLKSNETEYNRTLYKGRNWNHYISISGNPEWANNYISSKQQLEFESYDSLPYLIVNHWADSLNPHNKLKAYNYIKSIYNGGPSNGDGERFFYLFYRLKPIKTQNELLAYWNQDKGEYNVSIALLMSEFNATNRSAAKKLSEIRINCGGSDCDLVKYFNTAIFYLDPEKGKKEMTTYLNKEIQGKEAIYSNYSDVDKVLTTFAKEMCKSYDDLHILSQYVKADVVDTFGDLYRYNVLKEIYKKSPRLYKEILMELKQKERKTGKRNNILIWTKQDELKKRTKL